MLMIYDKIHYWKLERKFQSVISQFHGKDVPLVQPIIIIQQIKHLGIMLDCKWSKHIGLIVNTMRRRLQVYIVILLLKHVF